MQSHGDGPSGRLPIAGLLPVELAESLALSPSYRAAQIFRWVHRASAPDFSSMSDLPADLRARLSETALACSSSIEQRTDAPDGSLKLRIRCPDGSLIESMCLDDGHGRRTGCLSTQVGCGMGCAFCRTGLMGLRRNLEAHEIVEQFHHLSREAGELSNIVLMGMGEPFHNWNAVSRAVQVLNHPEGAGMGIRRFTVSTSGVVEGIRRLSTEGPDIKLAVSLVSADPQTRASLMPVAAANPLHELKDALRAYQRTRRHRITLEMVLIAGRTDRDSDIEALLRFIPPLSVMVNLIPWNPAPEIDFAEPSAERVRAYESRVAEAGIPVTQRMGKGRGVLGACGQLAVLGEREKR